MSENAEYDAAKEEQAEIESRIVVLEKMLLKSRIKLCTGQKEGHYGKRVKSPKSPKRRMCFTQLKDKHELGGRGK